MQTFFQPKNRWSPKKKVFTKIEPDFSAKIGNSNVFSSPKKKKVFTKIEPEFSAKIGNSNVFSAKKQVVSKKKRSSPKLSRQNRDSKVFSAQKQVVSRKKKKFSPEFILKFKRFFRLNHDMYFTTSAPNFLWGGLFSIFHQKSASKSPKTCDFAYFTSQWGGLQPPPPPLATLLKLLNAKLAYDTFKLNLLLGRT